MNAFDEFFAYYKECPVAEPITKAHTDKFVFIKDPYHGSLYGMIGDVDKKGFIIHGYRFKATGLEIANERIMFKNQEYLAKLVDSSIISDLTPRLYRESVCVTGDVDLFRNHMISTLFAMTEALKELGE